ncbi:M20/M25/M40 family metallo-hydrolase [bacterium]|nr:M20/M25/M40 family metallo-hydrolase [bacterium]
MVVNIETLQKIAAEELEAAATFLMKMIRYPSVPGQEHEMMQFIEREIAPLADKVERIEFPADFNKDPEYSFPVEGINYAGRFNLRAVVGDDSVKSPALIFNAHTDVVPASENQPRAFDPVRENGIIYGRGACDDKGSVATLYLLLRILKRLPEKPKAKVVIHLVNEEENGGNGTLRMIRTQEKADAFVVMEPTRGRLMPSVRGAVWFRVKLRGLAGHVGSAGKTVSALKLAVEAMELLEQYHAETLAASRGIQFFDDYPNPMPINFGRLTAGVWPASAPNAAVLEGVMGLLPNRTREQIMEGMERTLRERGSEKLRENFSFEFMYRHDSHVTDPDHKVVKLLQDGVKKVGMSGELTGMVASCDSNYYSNFLGMPGVVFGPGDLIVAHGADEQIEVNQLAQAAAAMANLAYQW